MRRKSIEEKKAGAWSLDELIPAAARAPAESLRASRDALALCLCAAVAHGLMALLYWGQGMGLAALGAGATAAALALCPFALRAKQGAKRSALGLGSVLYLFYMLTAIRFGGPDAPGLSSLLLCPMAAFLITGPLSATRWMLWCLVSVAALLAAQQLGAHFPAPSVEERRFLSLGAMLTQFSLTLIALWRYQSKRASSGAAFVERRKSPPGGSDL